MKLKKTFGSEAVKDLIREAQSRAAKVPDRTVRDPWIDDRVLTAGPSSTRQDK